MKPVQVLFDDDLLCELDADAEVKKLGRSKVLRALAAEYLEQRRQAAIDSQYAAGYGGDSRVNEEFAEWDAEGSWPDE